MAEGNNFILDLVASIQNKMSQTQLNSDIRSIKKQLNKLQLKAEIDPESIAGIQKKLESIKIRAEISPEAVQDIARQIEDITNRQGINISRINIGSGQAEKTGQQIGNGIERGLSSSLNGVRQSIDNVLREFNSQKLNSFDLSKMFNLNRPDISSFVTKQVRNLTNELNALAKEALKTNSDNSWEGIVNKINALSDVLNRFGKNRDLSSFKESLDVLSQFQGKRIFVSDKSEVLQNTGLSIRELNRQFRNLNVSFTTSKKNSIELDSVWTELFNISPNFEKFTTFGDQIAAVVDHLKIAKEAMYGSSSLQPLNGNEVRNELFGWMDRLEEASKKITLLREQETEIEQQISQQSAASAATVIQNEEKKQQAYRQTADAQKQTARDESLIKSGANVITFENTNNAAREALQYFKELMKSETELIAVSERFNKANELTSFAVNVRRASNEVETLRYALENIGTESDPFHVFKNIGGELNNFSAVKQMQQMEKIITDYQTRLENLKTKYSKTSLDYSGFEKVFNDFKNGIGTVNDLKIAFNQLENSAKMGVQSLKSQKASLDPIQQALNNMRDMPTMLKNLETNMAGLQDRTGLVGVSVDDLTSRYMKLKNEMNASGGKIPLDGSWAKEYQKLMSDVVSATRRVTAEQAKAEKSAHSLFASFKKNFSFLSYWTSAHYIFMRAVRGIKEIIRNVRELDDALTNISYTMDISGRQLKDIGESSLQMAKDLNTSASNVLGAVKLYANAKETAQSILDKAKPAVMLSNVTGFSGEESAKYLQTIMNQSDLAQDDLMDISDTIQSVSQNVAHDFSDGIVQINEGISASGEVARAAGMDLADYASMVGLLVEKTGLAGSQIGNSLKTIMTRTTKAGKIMGIDEGEISDAEKSLRSVGIEVRKTDGEFEDFNITMRELSKQWDSLSEVEKSNISFNLAGTRQINVIQTLLRNWSAYEDLVNKANNSTGVTLENQEIYAESLKGKLGELSAVWENIGDNAISSDFLKGLADAGIAVSSLIEKFGLFKTVIATTAVTAFVKNFA